MSAHKRTSGSGFVLRLLAILMGSMLLTGTVAVSSAKAVGYTTATHAVGIRFQGGPGHYGTVWAGTWNNGVRGFCIDFGLAIPDHASNPVIAGTIPGLTIVKSNRAKFIANKWWSSNSSTAAATASLAMWRMIGSTNVNTWYSWATSHGVISSAQNAAVNVVLNDAASYSARMTVTAKPVLVGQQTTGAVKALNTAGHAIVGRSVRLTATNAQILTVNGIRGTSGLTRSTGMALTYKRTGSSTVSFRALMTAPSALRATISTSMSGHQRTLGGGYTTSTTAYFSYSMAPRTPTITSVCGTNCDGMSTVTFSYCNPSGAQMVKWTEKVGTSVVGTFGVPTAGCAHTSAQVSDGNVIASSYCYTTVLNGPCTTSSVTMPTKFEVVCPAWAQGDLTIPCTCAQTSPAYATFLSPQTSPRYYRGIININDGAVTYEVDLVNGTSNKVTTGNLGSGTHVVVSFVAYRDAARTIPLLTQVTRNVTIN